MKKLWKLAALLLLAAALAGCGEAAPEQTTQPLETTIPPETTQPVEEDVVYFSNSLEMNRLYRVRTNGRELQLVIDESCDEVTQQGDTVYYLNDEGLQAYHIPTGKTHLIADGALDYGVSGDFVAYTVASQSYFIGDLYCQNLSTGEKWLVETLDMGQFGISGDYLYYTTYDPDTYNLILHGVCLRDRNRTVISRDHHSYFGFHPCSGGILLEAYGVDGIGYYVASGETGTLTPFAPAVVAGAESVMPGETGCLVTRYDFYDYRPTLYVLDAAGNQTRILTAGEDQYFFSRRVGEDLWLVEYSGYLGLGAQNEYGGYEYYCTPNQYLLVNAAGTVTPIDAAGEMGSLFAGGIFLSSTAPPPASLSPPPSIARFPPISAMVGKCPFAPPPTAHG